MLSDEIPQRWQKVLWQINWEMLSPGWMFLLQVMVLVEHTNGPWANPWSGRNRFPVFFVAWVPLCSCFCTAEGSCVDCQVGKVAVWKVSQRGHKPFFAVPTNTTLFLIHLFIAVGVEVQQSSNKQAESLFLPRNFTTILWMMPIHTATICQKHAYQV